MGLCKCPKRQVTNQFCFEHRVNVCEHCMVNSHPKCIVQSYLQWLKDSDYDSTCTLCKNSLESDDCVRLSCFHVFHWSCLNEREAELPSNTAPGGHTCPTCYDQIFPPSNLISPVADELRSRLRNCEWGLSGLGFLMASNESTTQTQENSRSFENFNARNNNETEHSVHQSTASAQGKTNREASRDYSVFSIDPNPLNFQASSRKPLLSRNTPIGMDHDDNNKYKRRAPAEIFSRWSRRFYVPSTRPIWRRTWFTVLCGIGIFIFFIYLISSMRRGDPFDDLRSLNDEDRVDFPHV